MTDEGYMAVAGVAVVLAVVGGAIWRWIEIVRDKAHRRGTAGRRIPECDGQSGEDYSHLIPRGWRATASPSEAHGRL